MTAFVNNWWRDAAQQGTSELCADGVQLRLTSSLCVWSRAEVMTV